MGVFPGEKIYLNKYIQKFMCWYSTNLKDCAHLQEACESYNLLLGLTTDQHCLPLYTSPLGKKTGRRPTSLGYTIKPYFIFFNSALGIFIFFLWDWLSLWYSGVWGETTSSNIHFFFKLNLAQREFLWNMRKASVCFHSEDSFPRTADEFTRYFSWRADMVHAYELLFPSHCSE